MVTHLYLRGVSECKKRAVRKHHINMPVQPYKKLHQMLVHHKDKINQDKKCNVMYKIPCLSCNKTCIGETGRRFNTCKKEHQTKSEKDSTETNKINKRQSTTRGQIRIKSAMTVTVNHCRRGNRNGLGQLQSYSTTTSTSTGAARQLKYENEAGG